MAGHEKLGPFEKKFYLMALLTFASTDGMPGEGELAIVRGVSQELHGHIHESDFHAYDVNEIVRGVKHADVQRDLLARMVEIGIAAGRPSPARLGLLKFFAEQWKLPLPAIGDLDWATVALPNVATVQQHSDAHKPMVHAYWKTHLKDEAAASRGMHRTVVLLILLIGACIGFKFGYYDGQAAWSTNAARGELLDIAFSVAAAQSTALTEKRPHLERLARTGGLTPPGLIATRDAKLYAAKTRLLAASLLPIESAIAGKEESFQADLRALEQAREECAELMAGDQVYRFSGHVLERFKPGRFVDMNEITRMLDQVAAVGTQ